jgi:isopropylmalate/homocitrate/citramalate synthase
MMGKKKINPERVYYNYEGQFPPSSLEPERPMSIPSPSARSHPKRITDTTLRDGAQDPCFALFPHETKLRYYDLLHELDNGTGRIENVEVFIYQKRDKWVLEKLLERNYEFPQVTTWTRATPKDIKLLVELSQGRVKETGMLASASDHHIFDKLNHPSKEAAIEKYLIPIMTALENGIRPRVHLEDATKADIAGWVIPFMKRVLDETKGRACFRICDTMGWGVPDPHAGLPTGIPKLISVLYEETGAELEFHGHNDFGLATANSIAAWIYGCNRVNTAFASMGERTGNTSFEQMLAAMVRFYGDPGLNLGVLAEITKLIHTEVYPVSSKAPLIGSGIFTTQAGLHQTGVQRHNEAPGGLIYLPYSPNLVGREQVELHRIGGLTGMEGVVTVLNQELEAEGEKRRHTMVSRTAKLIYDKVHDEYDGTWDEEERKYVNARTTFFESQELLEMSREVESGSGNMMETRNQKFAD